VTRIVRAVAAALALAAPAPAQIAYDHMRADGRAVVATEVAPGVHQFMIQRDGYVRMLNSIAIVTDDDVILFDTGTRPSTARIVLGMIHAITAKPVRYLINSHAHPDHWSANAVYADAFPGIGVIASADTDHYMRLMAPVWAPRLAGQYAQQKAALAAERASGKQADGTPLTPAQLAQDESDLTDVGTLAQELATLRRVYPTIIYRDTLHFAHGGRTLDLTATTGDQDGTTMAYLPDAHVLLSGDIVSFPIPYVSAHPSRQLASLKAIDAIDYAVLVPGHGPAQRDHAYLRLEIALLETVIAGVKREIAAGDGDLATLQDRVKADDLRQRFTGGDPDLERRYTARVRDLIRFAFQELTGSG